METMDADDDMPEINLEYSDEDEDDEDDEA
jgi:hypothetical protein